MCSRRSTRHRACSCSWRRCSILWNCMLTSRATRTWQSAAPCSSDFGCRPTLTAPSRRRPRQSSGGAGTSRSRRGYATTSTSRWRPSSADGDSGASPAACWSPSSPSACGTGQDGRLWSTDSSRASSSCGNSGRQKPATPCATVSATASSPSSPRCAPTWSSPCRSSSSRHGRWRKPSTTSATCPSA